MSNWAWRIKYRVRQKNSCLFEALYVSQFLEHKERKKYDNKVYLLDSQEAWKYILAPIYLVWKLMKFSMS